METRLPRAGWPYLCSTCSCGLACEREKKVSSEPPEFRLTVSQCPHPIDQISEGAGWVEPSNNHHTRPIVACGHWRQDVWMLCGSRGDINHVRGASYCPRGCSCYTIEKSFPVTPTHSDISEQFHGRLHLSVSQGGIRTRLTLGEGNIFSCNHSICSKLPAMLLPLSLITLTHVSRCLGILGSVLLAMR